MILRLSEQDDVGVALDGILRHEQQMLAGENPGASTVVALEDIPSGHKIALRDIPAGAPVLKYGQPIGRALTAIRVGEHVHTHNLGSALTGEEQYIYPSEPVAERTSAHPSVDAARRVTGRIPSDGTFEGYRRGDGRAGIRNEIWILPTVGCINGTVRQLAKAATERYGHIPGIDGIHSFEHPYGCSQLGEDLANTQDILRGLARHPNAGGVLIVGLGCENNRLTDMIASLGAFDRNRTLFLECQSVEDEIEEGLRRIGELVRIAAADVRTPIPLRELVIGLKCGGSDAFSGITANPLLGALTNRLHALGASAIMAEVPEMFGAEHLLMARCVSEDVYDRTVAMIRSYQDYYRSSNVPVYENPSPGNKDGGITTLEEKSLGCTRKGGEAPVVDVLRYGARLVTPGLNLLYSPGNDLVSCTALAAAGAHVICFTTGRGTPYGAPVPTLKISSNRSLAVRKASWIDVDAGILAETGDFDAQADLLLDRILGVASGRLHTNNEIHGHRDIAILKNGVTL